MSATTLGSERNYMFVAFFVEDGEMGISKKFDFRGIKKIEIPKVDADFMDLETSRATIKKYLGRILAEHQKNAIKEKYFYEYMLGKQDIYDKERLHNTDRDNNNKQVENHAFRQVNFKVGFLTGEKRDYTHKADSSSDDLVYLDRYQTDCNFFAKDRELKEWIYATGIGVTHCEPRTDIIVPSGIDNITGNATYRYATAQEGFDINYNAPFNFDVLEPYNNFVVYSSARNKEPLFCVSIVEVDVSQNAETIDIRKEMQIETRYHAFKIQSDLSYANFLNELQLVSTKVLRYIPMVEHSLNKARIGLIELNKDSFDAINLVRSSTSDMVVDGSNVIMIFKNTDITAEQIADMKKAGAVLIKDATDGKTGEADVKTIALEIPFEGLNNYVEKICVSAYDISGVPLASSDVSNGGDTGQAKLVGGGWNNAYIIINNDITALLEYDYEVLKQILLFSKQVPNSPLNEVNASQIDIKYRINQNDNFLVKAQGIMNLYGVNMPKEEIIKVSGLFSDVTTVARKWELEDQKVKEQARQTEQINVTENMANGTATTETEQTQDNNGISGN